MLLTLVGDLKQYIGDKGYSNSKITIETLSNAFIELVNSLENININKINLDNTKDFNNQILNYENCEKNRYMLSLLLISFIDLGIIEINI